jgi:hypothetical protein
VRPDNGGTKQKPPRRKKISQKGSEIILASDQEVGVGLRRRGLIRGSLKLRILRALSPGCRLGIAWWLFPDEDHNGDGRHIGYLERRSQWRHLDPELFDALGEIVSSGQRDVRALEAADILPGAVFASDVIPVDGPTPQRRPAREQWFASVQRTLEGADLVFVDPDNGLEPDGYSHGSAKSGKSVLLSELRDRRPSREACQSKEWPRFHHVRSLS